MVAELQAQQLPLFTQYREYHSIINPATINSDYFTHDYNVSIGASYRTQWVSEKGTPNTQVIRYENHFTKGKHTGLVFGGHIINDQAGPLGTTGIAIRTGIVLSNDPDWWGFVGGLSLGLTQFRINKNKIETYDPLLSECDCQSLSPDVGLGLFVYNRFSSGFFDQDVLYGGISMPRAVTFDPTFKANEQAEITFDRVPHYFGLIGLYKQLSDYQYLEPSIWIKYVEHAPINIDFNIRYSPTETFWLGFGYATSKTFHLEAGILLGENLDWDNTMRIGYGMDRGINAYGPFYGLSHELNITYVFDN